MARSEELDHAALALEALQLGLQLAHLERFGQEIRRTGLDEVRIRIVPRMPCHHDDLICQAKLPDSLEQLETIEAVHSDVGDQQVAGMLPQPFEGLLAILGPVAGIPLEPEVILYHAAVGRLVVHHQDSFAPGLTHGDSSSD